MGSTPEVRQALSELRCDGAHTHGRLKIDLIKNKEQAFESRAMAAYPPGLTGPWAAGVRGFHVRILDEARELTEHAALPRLAPEAMQEAIRAAFAKRYPAEGAIGGRGELMVDRGHRRRPHS